MQLLLYHRLATTMYKRGDNGNGDGNLITERRNSLQSVEVGLSPSLVAG